ncbi:MAG TPA: AraC family transcriptional regulator [Gemmatimonadaceae bacterium]|nr:AraC family transcriptional regulator [Gemmatimonadaceae bacterium]
MPSEAARELVARPERVGEVGEVGRAAHHMVGTVAAYVRQHFAREITNAELAALIGVSPSYMTRIFRRITRVSPQAYVRRVRLVTAVRLARAGYSQREVASLTGYSSKCHLSRSFTRTFGQTLGSFVRSGRQAVSEGEEAPA